jgi:hypothetical protein
MIARRPKGSVVERKMRMMRRWRLLSPIMLNQQEMLTKEIWLCPIFKKQLADVSLVSV